MSGNLPSIGGSSKAGGFEDINIEESKDDEEAKAKKEQEKKER